MHILLIDYDADSRAEVTSFLQKMGHHVTEQSDVGEAYTPYTEGAFSMVLADKKLPALLEEDLLHRITALPGETADVVLFTNYDDRGTTVEILRKGAYDYRPKPVNVIELAAITDRIVEYHLLLYENKVLTEYLGAGVGHEVL